MLDIFRTDAFSLVALTDAILKMPFTPGRLGALGLFRASGIPTTSIIIEEKDGRLGLIPTTPRGAPADSLGESRRMARAFVVPHLARETRILADAIQGKRVFGSEDQTEVVQAVVNERLADLRRMHEVTLEYHRIGALKGLILDADGTTPVYNLFTEFGVVQQTYEIPAFDDQDPTSETRANVVAIQRLIEAELGAEPISGYHALCGADFFDGFITRADVREALKYQESRILREDLRQGFAYGGVLWEDYGRAKVGNVAFIPADTAYVFPLGTDLFRTYYAPADFVETANTLGLPLYAKLAPDAQYNRWVDVHSQSNPLCLNLRPRAVVEVTLAAS